MISQEAKDKLDIRLISGEISRKEYNEILDTIKGGTSSIGASKAESKTDGSISAASAGTKSPKAQKEPTQQVHVRHTERLEAERPLVAKPTVGREQTISSEPKQVAFSGIGMVVYKWAYLVVLLGSFAMTILAFKFYRGDFGWVGGGTIDRTIFTTAGLLMAAVFIFWSVIYKGWKAIQGKTARTTPGKAVGFMFIPFYNAYWIFQAIAGLAADIKRSEGESHVSYGFSITFCIGVLLNGILSNGLLRLDSGIFYVMFSSVAALTIGVPIVFQCANYVESKQSQN